MSYQLRTGLTVIERDDWRAQYPDGYDDADLPAEDVWLHHSATIAPDLVPPFTDDDAAVRTLERIGQERFKAGISYTFPLTPVGRLYEGHTLGRAGAHTYGHNFTGRAIVLVGNYSKTPPTAAQIDAAAQLLAHGAVSGWWERPALSGGHRDTGRATDCPGDAAARAIPEINARAAWWFARLTGATPPPMEDPMPPTPTVLGALAEIRDGLARLYRSGFASTGPDGKPDPTHRAVSVYGTNLRLDQLIAEQRRTNQLLGQLVAGEQPPAPPST